MLARSREGVVVLERAGVPPDNWVSAVLPGGEGRGDGGETPSAPAQPDEKKTLPVTGSTCGGRKGENVF